MSQPLGGRKHDGCLRLVAETGFLLARQAGHCPQLSGHPGSKLVHGGQGDGWELLRDEREREKGFIFFWTPLGKSSGVGDGDRIIAKAFLGL